MRLRFSLRTLLFFMVVACVAMGLATNFVYQVYQTAERHRIALDVFDDGPFLHDGKVYQGRRLNGPAVVPPPTKWVAFARERIHPLAYFEMDTMYVYQGWSYARPKFKEFRNLNGLHEFSGIIDSFTMEDASNIRAIPKLTACIFKTEGAVEKGAMALLAGDPRITKFCLHPIDVDTMTAISKNQSLTEVYVGVEGVTPETLQILAKSRSIKKLCLMEIKVNAELLRPLREMPQLAEIELGACEIDETGMEEMSQMHLETIIIQWPKVESIAGIAELSKIPSLRRLTVNNRFDRTDGDIASFAKCPRLEHLELSEESINAESLRALGKSQSLKKAIFFGELPDDAAQAFVDAADGRELLLYPEGIKGSLQMTPKIKKYVSRKQGPK